MAIIGTTGNDVLNGTAGDNAFQLFQGGDDTANGLDGNDTFVFGAAFTAADHIDGGNGNDVVMLNGNYGGVNAVVFDATTMANVETIQLGANYCYRLKSDDATVAAGKTLTVDGSLLGATKFMKFSGSHETDGSFDLIGGAGDDTLVGGRRHDIFDLSHGGSDHANGCGGADFFQMGVFNAWDFIDGGLGNDTVRISGSGGIHFWLDGSVFANVETIRLTHGSYHISLGDSLLAAGQSITIDGSALNKTLDFNVTGESDGTVHVISNASNTIVTANAANFANGLTL